MRLKAGRNLVIMIMFASTAKKKGHIGFEYNKLHNKNKNKNALKIRRKIA